MTSLWNVFWVVIVALLLFNILHRLGIHCIGVRCGGFVVVSSSIGMLVPATCCSQARAIHASYNSVPVLQSEVVNALMHEMEYSTYKGHSPSPREPVNCRRPQLENCSYSHIFGVTVL